MLSSLQACSQKKPAIHPPTLPMAHLQKLHRLGFKVCIENFTAQDFTLIFTDYWFSW